MPNVETEQNRVAVWLYLLLTVIDANRAAPDGAPPHPCNAHRRERTPHDSLGRQDDAVYAGDREPLAKFEGTKTDDPAH